MMILLRTFGATTAQTNSGCRLQLSIIVIFFGGAYTNTHPTTYDANEILKRFSFDLPKAPKKRFRFCKASTASRDISYVYEARSHPHAAGTCHPRINHSQKRLRPIHFPRV